jgi:hypothetical protein
MAEQEAANEASGQLSKDLFSGAMGGIAQVLIGECEMAMFIHKGSMC